MEQRKRWIDEEVSFGSELQEFDDRLVEEWRGLHGPLQDDCDVGIKDPVVGGRSLLDWSHSDAPREIAPIRNRWTAPYLVRGTYQQLAHELRVGWHPKYLAVFRDEANNAQSDEDPDAVD